MTVASAFDKLAPDWDAQHGPGSPNARRHDDRIAYLRALCERRRPGRVIEIGCGTGLNLSGIAELVSEGVGVDCSPAMIGRACEREIPHLRFATADALSISPNDWGRFDLVMFVGTLEHIADQPQALRTSHALLAPGGCLLVIMPHPLQPRHLMAGAPVVDGEALGTWLLSPWRLREAAAREGLRPSALSRLSPLGSQRPWRALPYSRSGSLLAALGQAYAAELCAASSRD